MKHTTQLALIMLSVAFTAISTVGATFAWYQIQVNASALYNGASIGNSTKFEIGLKSTAVLTNYASYNLKRDDNDSSLYWSDSDLSSETLNYYLSANGYATNVLDGVTSGSYSKGDAFSLKSNPSYLNNYSSSSVASHANYIHFDFIFRVIDLKDNTQNTSGSVILKDFSLNGEGNVYQTLRVHCESDSYKGIFNLNSKTDGSTKVAGVLDLNEDGFYDYETSIDNEGQVSYKEYLYGNYTSDSVTYKTETGSDTATYKGNSFEGVHKANVNAVDQYTALYSNYEGTEKIIDQSQILCTVDATKKYASLAMDLYLEGWDEKFIDNIKSQKFGLSLNFESS